MDRGPRPFGVPGAEEPAPLVRHWRRWCRNAGGVSQPFPGLDPGPRTYSTDEVLELLGGLVTYRQVDYWVRQGYVEADRPARGSGSQRRFSEDNVRVIAAVAGLAALGCRGVRWRHAADELRAVASHRHGYLVVAHSGEAEFVDSEVLRAGLPGAVERRSPCWIVPVRRSFSRKDFTLG